MFKYIIRPTTLKKEVRDHYDMFENNLSIIFLKSINSNKLIIRQLTLLFIFYNSPYLNSKLNSPLL